MYSLDEHLVPWIEAFSDYVESIDINEKDDEAIVFKIMYEASVELFLSILQPETTQSVDAILTRSLIECYADVFAVFRSSSQLKQAKKYTKYAQKLTRLFQDQSLAYATARDHGSVTTRPFELARSYQSAWNGMNVIARLRT